jgi:hypothetical protein
VVPPGSQGLGKLVTASELLVQPAPDGMRHDGARVARLVAAFLARREAPIARDERTIDVRALVEDASVIDGPAAERLTTALGWDETALVRVRVRVSPAGSARPTEVARAFGVWGDEDPRAPHARLARLGLVGLDQPSVAAVVGQAAHDSMRGSSSSATGAASSGQTITSA